MPENLSDHERVASSGAWLGFGLGVSVLGWLDGRMPHLLAFLLNWSSVLVVCYFMARWKRAWYAWVAFWAMAALCPIGGILELAGLLRSQWSTAAWVTGCAMVFVWYWLVRMPRLHPPKLPDVTHIIHHHVIHGAGAALPPGVDVTQLPGSVPAGLGAAERPAVSGTAPKAIEAYAVRPGAFIGRRGELAARLREIRKGPGR